MNSKALPLTESSVQNHARVEFNGCPQDVISGVRFMGEGLAEFTPVGEPVYHTSFLFKTEQLVGVMLDVSVSQAHICTHAFMHSHSLVPNQYLSCYSFHKEVQIMNVPFYCIFRSCKHVETSNSN